MSVYIFMLRISRARAYTGYMCLRVYSLTIELSHKRARMYKHAGASERARTHKQTNRLLKNVCVIF